MAPPQGSPLSPILFMLYATPLFEIGHGAEKLGYADDIAILATGSNI